MGEVIGSAFGGKAMAGLGFGSSKKMTTPEGFVEGSIGWETMARVLVDMQANTWFEDYGLIPLEETLQPGAVDADESVAFLWKAIGPVGNDGEPNLAIPGLEIQESDLGEEINLDEGILGPAITSTLASLGVQWNFETTVALDEGLVEIPGLRTAGVAIWQTYFDMPIEQRFRVFRNSRGEETCLWSANLLAATRPFEHLTFREVRASDSDEVFQCEISQEALSRGALTFGQWSTKALIPFLAKRLFYMAETPFPSNVLASFTRQIAFGLEFPAENYPRPVVINKRKSYARGAFNEVSASGSLMPNVVEFGWTFKTTDTSEIQTILEVISNGLTKMATILEDGYLNYRRDDFGYSFDDVLLSATKFDSDYEQGGDALGLSYWVPVPRLGFLLNDTNLRAEAAVNRGVVEEQDWVAANGAGFWVPNAINSFVFSTLIPAEQWFTIDRLLDSSVRMDVPNESTNSLSNWGIAKYKQGLISEAIEKFEAALARDDKFAEAEASYWLALIYEQNDDEKLAKVYRDRCEAAGGYVEEEPDQPTPSGLSKSAKAGLGLGDASGLSESRTLAAFCSNCGNKFTEDSAKFCGNCGKAR